MPRKTVGRVPETRPTDRASMRPRPDAAENGSSSRPRPGGRRCFNEAAARCRGKPRLAPLYEPASTVLQ